MTTTTVNEVNRLSPEKKRALLAQLLAEKAGQASAIPLSSGQQRLWFLDRLEPNSPLYNIAAALRLTGDLNATALSAALDQIVQRHEALRTTFPSVDGAPHQRINPPSPAPFSTVDLTAVPAAEREGEAQRRLTEAANQPFDLSRDLMIRATLLKLAPREYILLMVVHHIAGDEWSLRVLFKELALLYESRVTGTNLRLPDLPIQYADYSNWQREHLQGDTLENLLAYWRKQLDGCTPNLELPSDFPRCANKHRGALAYHSIPRSDLEAIKSLGKSENATLFMTCLAAFYTLLNRYTRQDDILVGSPIAGRTRAETEELIGFFVNTLVLRAQLRERMTFRELLAQVRETTLGAYAHQELPFEKLVETLHPERSSSGSPLVQVMFALNTEFIQEQLLPGLRAELVPVDPGTAKFDLTLVAEEDRQGLRLTAEFDTDILTPEAVQRLLSQFANILRVVSRQPDLEIQKISFLDAAEKQKLVHEFNSTRTEYPRDASISRLVEAWVAARPKSTAISCGARAVNYAWVNARANQVAHRLLRGGLQRGEFVGIIGERSIEIIVAMLGILKAGGAYLPLDPAYPADRLAFMLKDSAACCILSQPALRHCIDSQSLTVLEIDQNLSAFASEPDANLDFSPDPTDLANVIYTSGSTGIPKGVLVQHRGVVRLIRNTNYMEFDPSDVFVQSSSISFDAATWEIWGALANGARVAVIAKEDLIHPTAYRAKLLSTGATTIFLTTGLFNQLAVETPGIFGTLKCVCFGGEACDPNAIASVLQNGPPRRLMHVYGPTETTVYATGYRVQEVAPGVRTVPIGKPISNTTAYIVDSAGELAPLGAPGELWLGGDGVSRGYLNRPELTAERFIPDRFSGEPGAKLYRSGDLVRYREDGSIEFLGRLDNQVKIRGFRIELGEIEATLLKHPSIRKAAVIAREERPGSKRLVAYLELAPAQSIDVSEVKNFLRQSLPDFMTPSAFMVLEKIPMLPNGKTDRKALPAPEFNSAGRVFQAPSDPLEQQIAKIWERILGVQPIGVTDNFFDLGGHSLLAVKLFAQFEKIFERKLPLATLFKAPTIRQLAEIVRGESKPQAWSTVVDIQPRGAKPPIFWIHSLGGDGGGGFFYYRKLAELLGEDQPSYGIRSPQDPFDKIEDMAAYYIRAIREVQPQGPYQLGGFCFGGVVAYEMARQLEAAGDRVSLLAILESSPPNLDKMRDFSAEAARFSIENVYENLREFASHSRREQVAMVRRKARKWRDRLSRRRAGTADKPAALKEMIDMSKYPKDYVKYAETHWKALESYRPGPYNGPIHLFRARKQPLRSFDPSMGWNALAPGRVKITVIPGTHESMVQEPNVRILSAKIQEALTKSS